MMLYRIEGRALVEVRQLTATECASVGRDWDSWLHSQGLGGGQYTLRRGRVVEATAQESAALASEVARLKAQGKLPSALGAITERLGRGA